MNLIRRGILLDTSLCPMYNLHDQTIDQTLNTNNFDSL